MACVNNYTTSLQQNTPNKHPTPQYLKSELTAVNTNEMSIPNLTSIDTAAVTIDKLSQLQYIKWNGFCLSPYSLYRIS